MQICHSTALLSIAIAVFAFAPASWAARGTTDSSSAPPPAQRGNSNRLPAVALSYDGQYLAWIVPQRGKAELVLASGGASHPHAVSVPDDCNVEGLRWAHRWNRLALLTRCAGGPGSTQPVHGAIWLLDVHAGTPPRKLANVIGFAQGMQWTTDNKQIAFLYRPAATVTPEADSSDVAQAGASGARSVVVAVTVSDGSLHVLTPVALNVHEFRLSPSGHALGYTAAPATDGGHPTTPSLYSQQTIAHATPALVFDPGTAKGSLHDLQITLPRWASGSQIIFIGRSTGDRDATGGDLYLMAARGGMPENLTRQERVKPTWFTFHRNHVLVTQVVDGTTQVAGYRLMGSWAKQTALLFTVPGAIGDGRAPSALTTSYVFGRRSRIAYFQRGSAQTPPVLHAGLIGTHPPPMVAATNAAHRVDSTSQVRDKRGQVLRLPREPAIPTNP